MKKNRTCGCVRMTGPDVRMDRIGSDFDPANRLPVKCSHCTFPDLTFVSRPYLLTKGISSDVESSPAEMGNFLVRERVRRILELVTPEACIFHPTADWKSKKPAPWWLVVPKEILEVPCPKASPPCCSECGEPKVWCYQTDDFWAKMKVFDTRGIDVFKSRSWNSRPETVEDAYEKTNRYRKEIGEPPLPWSHWGVESPTHPERWTRKMLDRELFFSIRLDELFKRAKVRGQLVRFYNFKEVEPTPDDEAWVEKKLQLLAEHGLVDAPKQAASKAASAVAKWFKEFVKRNTEKGLKLVDFATVETKGKLALPKDYKDFISAVGTRSFEDVCDMKGSTTTVLPPQKLDFKNYRRGRVPHLEGDDAKVDGVMFASTDYGDCFLFDVSAKGKDYPVFWYRHEENTLEPFAPNFAECIKRFVQKN